MKTLLIEELNKFGINIERLYSLTTDSGSNIKKMIKLVDNFYRARCFGDMLEMNDVDDDAVNALMERIANQSWGYDRIIGRYIYDDLNIFYQTIPIINIFLFSMCSNRSNMRCP